MFRLLFYLTILLHLFACENSSEATVDRKVQIMETNGKFIISKDGQPFTIKGAGGTSQFHRLSRAGGNTLRVWDTTNLAVVLDSAHANKLSVIVGLPVYDNKFLSFYDNQSKVDTQFALFKRVVNKHKRHPALLMWCLGNELTFSTRLSYLRFYKAFNDLTDMIHQDDPDHPVTTALLNFNRTHIINLSLRCDLDLISFNLFGGLGTLKAKLKDFSWIWDGPYLLTEWGIDGAWAGKEQAAWGAYIEDTSNKKAEIYYNYYVKNVPTEDPRFLGACVFFWGQKQEGTHTWFSMFDESGGASEAVDVMQLLWSGKRSGKSFPKIDYMLLNKKGARDNVMLSVNSKISAELILSNDIKEFKSISWEVYPEDWYRKDGRSQDQKLKPLFSGTYKTLKRQISLQSPAREGPYRIFAKIYDRNGNFATCNTPFYVIQDKEL